MLRKFLIALVVLAVLLAVSVFLVWRAMGPTDPARFLPAGTAVYVALPDLPRSALRWQSTSFSKIGGEAAVKEFLKKPQEALTGEAGNEAAEILMGLKPGRIFFAITDVQDYKMAGVLGFQYFGGQQDLDRALQRLRENLGEISELRKVTHEGDEITISVHKLGTLYSAAHGRWGLLSNDENALKGVLDRLAEREASPVLADDEEYVATMKEVSSSPDFLAFVRAQPFVNLLLETGQKMGAVADPKQVEKLRKVRAVATTTKMEGANMRDATFVLMDKGEQPSMPVLTRQAMALAGEGTLICFSSVIDAGQLTNPDAATLAMLPPAWQELLQREELQLKQLMEAVIPELTVLMNWPAESFKPDVLAAVPVRNAEVAGQWVGSWAATLSQEVIRSENEGSVFYVFPLENMPLVRPTVAVTPEFILIGIDEVSVMTAATSKPERALTDSAVFRPALPLYQQANSQFGYVDTAALFTRLYQIGQSVAGLWLSMQPAVQEYVDITKLPPADAIAKHLDPIIYAQRELPNGYLIESTGPLTYNQFAIMTLVGVAGMQATKSPGQ